MKERLINNLGLKVLSIFLAFFVWLVVVNVSNPEVSRTKEVQLEIENEQVLLAANRAYELKLSGKNTVTVTYEVRTRDEYKIKASDFRAYIDLSELYDVTGSVPIKVEVLNNKEILANVAARPVVARIETEDLQRKGFELNIVMDGTPAEGYAANGATAEPGYIYVEGPVSQVGLISSVGLEIRIDGASEDLSGMASPVFYDANGNKLLLSDRVHVDTAQVNYYVTMNKVKRLNLDFDVSGTAAPGYRYVGVESDAQSVAVIGLKTDLAAINKITIPSTVLNVDGATQDKVVSVDLENYLPEGVVIAKSETAAVNVLLKIEPLQTRSFRLSENEIQKNGTDNEFNYHIQPRQIEVVLQGLGDDLTSLSTADLGARIDVTGMDEGSHKGVLIINRSDIFTVLSYTDFTMEVTPKINAETTTAGTVEHSQSAAATTAHETTGPAYSESSIAESESGSIPVESSAADR